MLGHVARVMLVVIRHLILLWSKITSIVRVRQRLRRSRLKILVLAHVVSESWIVIIRLVVLIHLILIWDRRLEVRVHMTLIKVGLIRLHVKVGLICLHVKIRLA